jgi:calcium-dependent protein kinase
MASCKSVDSSHRVSSIWEVFQELELAGEGTYGITYKAAPKDKLGQVVALKCISKKSPPGINLPRFKIAQNFDTEVELLRECDHPYIVKLLDTFEDDQFFVLVMEWLAGGQLFQRIVALDHFSELAASLVVSRMVSAVRYLHYKDIAHLDLVSETWKLEVISDLEA